MPVASATKLGGIKIGNGLTIDENGVVSVNGGGGETPNLDAVLTKGNTTSKDINISGKIASEIASNRIHSQGYTVSKADDTATSGGGGSRTTSIGSGEPGFPAFRRTGACGREWGTWRAPKCRCSNLCMHAPGREA